MITKYLTTIAFSFLILTSCNSDIESSEQINGLWNFQSIIAFDCMEEEQNIVENFGNASCEEKNGATHCLNGTANFLDGIVIYTYNNLINGVLDEQLIQEGTYSFSSQNDNQIAICFDSCMVGILTLSSSTLNFDYKDTNCNYRISAFK